jgi:hypothetical protein
VTEAPYLSHPVRRVREDPDPDPQTTVDLAVEPTDEAVDLAGVLADLDGRLVREARFVTVVRLPERRVGAFLDRVGADLDRVETAETLGLALEPEAAVAESLDEGTLEE